MCCEACYGVFVEKSFLCVVLPAELIKAPHDSGVCLKQFMMLQEEVLVCGGVSFHLPCTSRVDEGIRVAL